MNKYFTLALLTLMLACTSGKKALQRGNYEESVLKAINRLRSSPNNDKARETLRQGYPMTVSYHQDRITNLKNSGNPFFWESILDSYVRLNTIYQEIQRCPACLQEVRDAKSYQTEIADTKMLAASDRYQAGIGAFDRDHSRLSAKEAYLNFRRAFELVPNYKDTRQRMDEAYFHATLKVVLEQIPVHSRSLSLSNEFFQNKINEYVSSNRMNEFVRFYTPQEAKTTKLDHPDHVIRLQFDDFVVGQVYLKENTETFSRDSVVVGKTEVDGAKRNVYGTVTAKYTVFRKTVSSRGLLDMQILDPNANRIVNQEKLPGEFVWVSEWASFKGDERALDKKQLELCNRREVPAPPPQDLFIEFCKPIYSQVTGSLSRYYRNY